MQPIKQDAAGNKDPLANNGIHLVIGPMGAGKSTLRKYVVGFESDMVYRNPYKDCLDTYKKHRQWTAHNQLWFSLVWGGLLVWMQDHPGDAVVYDHGGWFILEADRPAELVRTVTVINVPVEVTVARVAPRFNGQVPKSYEDLTRSSHASFEKVVATWKGLVPKDRFHILDNTGDLEEVAKNLAVFTQRPGAILADGKPTESDKPLSQ